MKKDVYVILAFHAHELLWDLPEVLLSYLEDDNPMKDSIMETNYLQKRYEEGRDIYALCKRFGESLNVPLCVEFTNELLVQLRQVMPSTFEMLKKEYRRGRLYPIYGHAHHTHVALLRTDELAQEILWNRQYLHNQMGVPYPRYSGLFPTEDSLSYDKLDALEKANIDYVIFPHMRRDKDFFELIGEGDYTYKPFLIRAGKRKIIAFPRNFPVSQEIWRPITRMRRDEVKSQGYLLGDFPVFDNEYQKGERESFPISFDEGVEIYLSVLRRELGNAPHRGVIVYIQDLELMDFGDLALRIMEHSWKKLLQEDHDYRVHFVTPDLYIEEVVIPDGIENLPEVRFHQISWVPEVRLVLRPDGHYPPLGVTRNGYDIHTCGIYKHPLIFWENGKYYCGIFDTLLDNFGISLNVPVSVERLGETGYDLARESLDSQAVLYLRLMKRACNWGWVPTEGRQKRPYLKGYLLCEVLLRRLEEYTPALLSSEMEEIDRRSFVGLCETLKVFIDKRMEYLRYGLDELRREKEGIDLSRAYDLFPEIEKWKEMALEKAREMYCVYKKDSRDLFAFLKLLQGYSLAVYMATDRIQRVWAESGHTDFLVEKMYHYLFKIYPPLFPEMIDRIDSMSMGDVERYFEKEAAGVR